MSTRDLLGGGAWDCSSVNRPLSPVCPWSLQLIFPPLRNNIKRLQHNKQTKVYSRRGTWLDAGQKLSEIIGIIIVRPPGVNLPALFSVLLLLLLLYFFYYYYSSQVQPRWQAFSFEFISVHLAHILCAILSKLIMFYSSVRFSISIILLFCSKNSFTLQTRNLLVHFFFCLHL